MKILFVLLTLVVSLIGSTPAIANINAGIVAYYPFNGNADDESGNGNDGTVIGNVVLSSDRFDVENSAYTFNGKYANYISVPYTSLNSLEKGTIAVWIKLDQLNAWQWIFDKTSANVLNHFSFGISNDNRVILFIDGTEIPYFKSNQVISVDTWYHIAATWDGSFWRIFINGELDNQVESSRVVQDVNLPTFIGRSVHTYLGGQNTSAVIGSIDEIKIYNRDLMMDEVRELYNYNTNILAMIDINPGMLNLKSSGNYVTSYIELPEGFSVEEIDVDSVVIDKIDGEDLAIPLNVVGSSELGDYDENDIPDLSVKFDRQELILLLTTGDADLVISGSLTDGTSFEGSNSIRVISKGR